MSYIVYDYYVLFTQKKKEKGKKNKRKIQNKVLNTDAKVKIKGKKVWMLEF